MEKMVYPKALKTNSIYLANTIREVTEESYPLRNGVRYELIPKEVLDPFLTSDKNALHQISDASFRKAFTAFLEEGAESENFQQNKLPYLGEVELCLLDIYFDQLDEFAENSQMGWYEVEITEDGHYSCIASSILGDEAASYRCNIRMLPTEAQQMLKKIYQLVSSKGEPEIFPCNAIQQNTVIQSLVLYYVGAALCVEIHDTNQAVGFFDMGLYTGANSTNAFVRQNSLLAMINETLILSQLQNQPSQTVILSHWHDDHYNLLYSIRNNPLYHPFLQQSSFYVPQCGLQAAINLNQSVLNAGGAFHVQNNAAAPNINAFTINNNPHFLCRKIDAFANPYPHHHGIYAVVTLASGRLAFLAGDCTYAGIDANDRVQQYAYIQACHHGGNYAVSPAQRNINDIPWPNPGQNPTAVYSANGYTYGHPNPMFVNDHTAAGYTNPIPLYNWLRFIFN